MSRQISALILGLSMAAGCSDPAPDTSPATGAPASQVASASGGMVVSSSEPAARVGADILRAGGNAIDAAVAAAFALGVAEPTQSGLGGRTQALVWSPSTEPFGIDGTTVVPIGAPREPVTAEDGYSVIGIPGTVAALRRLHESGGVLGWADVLEPAIALARGGFALSEGEANRLEGIAERLSLSEGARGVFLAPDGAALGAGEVLRQPDLARVLQAIADEGSDVFYTGWVASAMVADFAEGGATVSAADLAGYEARPAIMTRGRFMSLDLVGTYLPASGGTTIEALQIIERLQVADLDPDSRAVAIGDALVAAYADRELARSDPRPPREDATWITSPGRAEEWAADIRADVAGDAPPVRDESGNTSHLSVMDENGMIVAMTQSLGPTGGSRVATPGLGFLYATTLGYLDAVEPGERPWSSQSPLIGLREGRPALVIGGAGGRRIVSAIVQTLVRTEIDGLGLEAAMGAARFHPTGRWHFEQLDETTEPAGAAMARARGQSVLVRPFEYYFGRLNAITVLEDGSLVGVADPRWAWGSAIGVNRGGWWAMRTLLAIRARPNPDRRPAPTRQTPRPDLVSDDVQGSGRARGDVRGIAVRPEPGRTTDHRRPSAPFQDPTPPRRPAPGTSGRTAPGAPGGSARSTSPGRRPR